MIAREVLSRIEETHGNIIASGPLTIDKENFELRIAGKEIPLSPRELKVLALLGNRLGCPTSRNDIKEAIWGSVEWVGLKTLDVAVGTIRKKIEADPANPVYLLTVRGEGYSLADLNLKTMIDFYAQ